MIAHAERILNAQNQAGLSQRQLAEISGISQSTLSRIISGTRIPSVPELLALAVATGLPFPTLANVEQASDRAQFAARATGESTMGEMKSALESYLNLSAFLDDQAIY